jgi:6-phosphogluconolactonase (cycloisomerase 2 family)
MTFLRTKLRIFSGTGLVVPGALILLLCLLAVLAGCGKFFVDNNGSSGGNGSTGIPKFAYTADFNGGAAGTVSAYGVNSTSGVLTGVSGGPFAAGNGPLALASDSAGKFVFVANQGGSISAFQVNRNSGALAAVAGSPFAGGTTPAGITVSSNGTLVYAANRGSGDVSGWSVNTSSGVLTSVGTAVATSGVPGTLVIDSTARFLYVTMGSAGTQVFQIGSDGRLTSLRTVPPSPCAGAAGVATDGNSRFVFVADGTSAVCTYAINPSNGDLLLITTAAVTAGTSPVFAAVSPDNAHLYVTNLGSKNVSVYTINADGSLSPVSGSPFSAGNSPSSVSVDPSGKFAYVTNFGDGTISTYTIGSNGALTSAGVTAAGVGPNEIVITQ